MKNYIEINIENIDEICELISSSIKDLFKYDSQLFEIDIKEETINHRLAIYIENRISEFLKSNNLNCDLEYSKFYTDKKKFFFNGKELVIRPDIIIHKRNDEYLNIIAIEIKKNNIDTFDIVKSYLYNKQLFYKYSVFINLNIKKKNEFQFVIFYNAGSEINYKIMPNSNNVINHKVNHKVNNIIQKLENLDFENLENYKRNSLINYLK